MIATNSRAAAPRLVVDFNDALLVAAGRGAVVKPPGVDRLAQHAFGRERVQNRLQRLAAADHEVLGGAHFPGLVIGHANSPGRIALEQVDRPAQAQPALDRDRLRRAMRIRLRAIAQPEAEFEPFGPPMLRILGRAPHPFAQVGADTVDSVAPHALDRRREILMPSRRNFVEPLVEQRGRVLQVFRRDRQHVELSQRRQDFVLDLRKQAAARERIERLDRLGFLARLQPMDRLQKKTIRACGEILQRGRRV